MFTTSSTAWETSSTRPFRLSRVSCLCRNVLEGRGKRKTRQAKRNAPAGSRCFQNQLPQNQHESSLHHPLGWRFSSFDLTKHQHQSPHPKTYSKVEIQWPIQDLISAAPVLRHVRFFSPWECSGFPSNGGVCRVWCGQKATGWRTPNSILNWRWANLTQMSARILGCKSIIYQALHQNIDQVKMLSC